MDRPTYWGWMVLSFIVMYAGGYMIGYTDPYGYETSIAMEMLVNGWVVFAWIIGYARVKDAGRHGAWAIFTPIFLGLIIIGCLKSRPQTNMLDATGR